MASCVMSESMTECVERPDKNERCGKRLETVASCPGVLTSNEKVSWLGLPETVEPWLNRTELISKWVGALESNAMCGNRMEDTR